MVETSGRAPNTDKPSLFPQVCQLIEVLKSGSSLWPMKEDVAKKDEGKWVERSLAWSGAEQG